MRQIKKLKVKTSEGFTLANYRSFPSMEWGDEGGYDCDVIFNGKNIGHLFQEGNGGCADFRYEHELTNDEINEIKSSLLTCLRRIDKSYGQDSEYKWLKNKTEKDINDDDFENLVVALIERESEVQSALKMFKKYVNITKVCLVRDALETHVHGLEGYFADDAIIRALLIKYPKAKASDIEIISDKTALAIY